MDLLSGFSNGLLLGITPFFLYSLKVTSSLTLWITIVLVAFFSALLTNVIVQLTVCKTIKPASLLQNSIYQPIFSAAFLGLSYIGPLSWAVEGLMSQETDSGFKKSLSQGFYLFWGAVYSQLLGSGFIQSCS